MENEALRAISEKYPRLSISSFSAGFQVIKFQKCSEIWLKESYIIPCIVKCEEIESALILFCS